MSSSPLPTHTEGETVVLGEQQQQWLDTFSYIFLSELQRADTLCGKLVWVWQHPSPSSEP